MFKVLFTPKFEKSMKKLCKKNKDIVRMYEKTVKILEEDAVNKKRIYNIKKLVAIENGSGEWRIRIGRYRIRYDIYDNDVVLYDINHRKDIYK